MRAPEVGLAREWVYIFRFSVFRCCEIAEWRASGPLIDLPQIFNKSLNIIEMDALIGREMFGRVGIGDK